MNVGENQVGMMKKQELTQEEEGEKTKVGGTSSE